MPEMHWMDGGGGGGCGYRMSAWSCPSRGRWVSLSPTRRRQPRWWCSTESAAQGLRQTAASLAVAGECRGGVGPWWWRCVWKRPGIEEGTNQPRNQARRQHKECRLPCICCGSNKNLLPFISVGHEDEQPQQQPEVSRRPPCFVRIMVVDGQRGEIPNRAPNDSMRWWSKEFQLPPGWTVVLSSPSSCGAVGSSTVSTVHHNTCVPTSGFFFWCANKHHSLRPPCVVQQKIARPNGLGSVSTLCWVRKLSSRAPESPRPSLIPSSMEGESPEDDRRGLGAPTTPKPVLGGFVSESGIPVSSTWTNSLFRVVFAIVERGALCRHVSPGSGWGSGESHGTLR